MAAEVGYVSLALSNSFPKVVAHGGEEPVLGTNPFAFGAPGPGGEHILVDLATSSAAGSTVRASRSEDGSTLRGPDGQLAERCLTSKGHLLPLGGAKGYALAVAVEVLAGVLSGAGICTGVHSMFSDRGIPGNKRAFFSGLPERDAPIGPEDLTDRMRILRDTLQASGAEVRLPGSSRMKYAAESRRLGDCYPGGSV